MNIPIERIYPNPEQPRVEFDKEKLRELADSIRQDGVIQAITVEEAEEGNYILHDGERRLRAAKMAGLKEIPATVTPALNGSGSKDRLVRALVANVQRADLNPIEEARAYAIMRDQHGMTQFEIGERCGVKWSRVAMRLKLLKLESEIQDMVGRGELPVSPTVTDKLLLIPDAGARVALARKVAGRKLSNDAIEQMAERVTKALTEQPYGKDLEEMPILKIAYRRGKGLDRSRWDMLAQVGSLPPWSAVNLAALEVCNACVLKPMASETTCKECPGVALLAAMLLKAGKTA